MKTKKGNVREILIALFILMCLIIIGVITLNATEELTLEELKQQRF